MSAHRPTVPAEWAITEWRRGVSIKCPCGREIGVAWETDRGLLLELAKRPPELNDLDGFVELAKRFEPGEKARFPSAVETVLVVAPDDYVHPESTHCERCTGRVLEVAPGDIFDALARHRTKIIAASRTPHR